MLRIGEWRSNVHAAGGGSRSASAPPDGRFNLGNKAAAKTGDRQKVHVCQEKPKQMWRESRGAEPGKERRASEQLASVLPSMLA